MASSVSYWPKLPLTVLYCYSGATRHLDGPQSLVVILQFDDCATCNLLSDNTHHKLDEYVWMYSVNKYIH